MSKTQINVWMPAPEGRETEVLNQLKHILKEEDVEFGVTIVSEQEDADMKLMFLSDELKDTVMIVFRLNMFRINNMDRSINPNDFFSKFAYQLRKEPIKGIIGKINKQYFIPASISKTVDDDLIEVDFLNTGNLTEEESNNLFRLINETIEKIYNDPSSFHNGYYEELKESNPLMNLEYSTEHDNHYRLLHDGEPMTIWYQHLVETEQWDDFLDKIYNHYKRNLSNKDAE